MTNRKTTKRRTSHRVKSRAWLLYLSLAIITAVLLALFIFTPSLDIRGGDSVTVEAGSPFEEKGAFVRIFGFIKLSADFEVEGSVDSSKLGDYTLTYTAHHLGRKLSCVRNVSVTDTKAPVIELASPEKSPTATTVAKWKDPGYSAKDAFEGDLTDKVKVEMIPDTDSLVCTVKYTVSDSSGNTAEAKRTFKFEKAGVPDLVLNGEENMTVTEPTFSDPGCRATDRDDGDISNGITVDTDYKEKTVGEFTFTYSVKNSSGISATCTRKVTVKDVTRPIIYLNGDSTVYLSVGDTYTDAGARGTDDFDGDVEVSASGTVDTGKEGTYVIKYVATDKSGNSSGAERTVRVSKSGTDSVVSDGDSVIYLTFDDGPTAGITSRILDTLKANNVKATFFIINYSDANKALVKRAIDEGHSVGIHGYSHSYDVIYASDEAFINNVTKLHDRLVSDFGYDSKLMRFPGGSSNKTSASYSKGIMSRLCPKMESLGYAYFDWNVLSGDADEATAPASYIINGATSGLRKGRANIVLMHDGPTKSTTADALQSIIDFGKKNGYTFAPLKHNSPTAHHRIQN